MSHVFVALWLMLSSTTAVFADERVPEANAAALQWLSHLDAGQYVKTWDEASSLFRSQGTLEQWQELISDVHAPFGKLVKRSFQSGQYFASLPGAPDGDYVILQYHAVYEKKRQAIETVTPMLEDGVWRVSGYYIK